MGPVNMSLLVTSLNQRIDCFFLFLQVVELLTGLERFVRLCVERKIELSADGKSPKVFGAPKPYTGLYGPSSYMANRPR